jgi:N-acetylglucosaminyldiphosphoundecaprenol N-acetyl-beta-D-mannosaminyltransferase
MKLSSTLDSLMIEVGAPPTSIVTDKNPDDLSREVYCILGIPVDAIEMADVLLRIDRAVSSKTPFLISTPNLNFLVNSQSDPDFTESLLSSDLSTADGMSIVWIARLLGVPVKHRISGSDFFDHFGHTPKKPLKVFLFGGAEGVAAAACGRLNARSAGVYCVGSLYPGFGSIEEMSQQDTIDHVNSSDADFLVTSLGAKKGQLWLQRNHHRLLIPVRAHLGASINFQAGTLKRAHPTVRELGFEWLWRIKEEPYLWKRYLNDGVVLMYLLFSRVLPLAIWTRWLRLKFRYYRKDLIITQTVARESITVGLSGAATAQHIEKIIIAFREAISTRKQIVIDFSNTYDIDARFLGLLIMLRKTAKASGTVLIFARLSPWLERMFRLNGLGHLLSSSPSHSPEVG